MAINIAMQERSVENPFTTARSLNNRVYTDPRTGLPYFVNAEGRSTWTLPVQKESKDTRSSFDSQVMVPPQPESKEHTWAVQHGECLIEGADVDKHSGGNINIAEDSIWQLGVKHKQKRDQRQLDRRSRLLMASNLMHTKRKTRKLRSQSTSSVQAAVQYNEKLAAVAQTELVFKDISVRINKPKKGGRDYILSSISGRIKKGELCALMGPSGGGKTTLLESLLGKSLAGLTVSGSVNASSRRNNGYVAQSDILPACSTVEELLNFHCAMKLPRSVTPQERNARVQSLLDMFGLRKAAHTFIGSATIKGISGGEKRRLSMACALVTVAPLLFVDEATTGLSAADALSVMHILRGLAYRGHSVMITIHQPRQDIVEMFDKILLLTRDGKLAYIGPPSQLVPHFEALGNTTCAPRANTADFALDVLTDPKLVGETAAVVFTKTDMYKEMHQYLRGEGEAKSESSTRAHADVEWEAADGTSTSMSLKTRSQYAKLAEDTEDPPPSCASRSCMLLKRNLLLEMRNKEVFAVQLGTSIELGVLIGTVYWQIDVDGDPFSVLALCFMMTVLQALGAITVLPAFISSRVLFSHEVSCKLYGTASFCVASFLTDLIMQGVYAIAMATPMFYMSGIGTNFGPFAAVNLVGRLAATTWAEYVCVFFSDPASANGAASGMMSFFVLFAGFVITRSNLPDLWKWANSASLLRYFYSPLVLGIANDQATSLEGRIQLAGLSELDFGVTVWWHVWMLCGFLFLFRMMHAVSMSALHTGHVMFRRRLGLLGISIATVVSVALWFSFVPSGLIGNTGPSTVPSVSAYVHVDAPRSTVYSILTNTSDAVHWDTFFVKHLPHASPVFPGASVSRRCWRQQNETGIYADETVTAISTTVNSSSISFLRHNINGYVKCPALNKMNFIFDQLVADRGAVMSGTLLETSATLAGADQVPRKDISDTNEVMQEVLRVIKMNLANVKALSEARHQDAAYERPHPYQEDGFLCQ